MNIGEKIKEIRTAKCMTQAQLAGDFITRNMLSLIENGEATPSIQTVEYLSARLNVPSGYLLARPEEEHIYRKIYNIDNIKRAFTDGDYRICRDICRSTGCEDDELNFILSRCSFEIAKEEFFVGKMRSALKHFEEALEYGQKTIYAGELIRAETAVYLKYMREISPTLTSDITDQEIACNITSNSLFCEYVYALDKLSKDGGQSISDIINDSQMPDGAPLTVHLLARDAMRKKEYADAKKHLQHILNLQERIADPVLYSVFFDLEICSREMDDYREAYEYSADKVNLLERMLTEADED